MSWVRERQDGAPHSAAEVAMIELSLIALTLLFLFLLRTWDRGYGK
jgi:hypothetical protein